MKKQILFLVAMLLILTKVLIAQSTAWVFPGNTPTSSDFLGSTNAADLIFKTNSTEVGRFIGVAGSNQYFLGIGTSSPNRLLDVFATSSNPQLRLSYDFTSSSNSHYADFKVFSTGDLTINPHGYSGGTDAYQSIGIGNFGSTAPSGKLEIYSPDVAQLRLSYDLTGTNTQLVTTSEGYFKFLPSAYRVGINVKPSSATLDVNPNGVNIDPLRLRNLATDNTLTNVLVADANGYVRQRTNVVLTCATTNQYYVPKFCSPATSIQNSQIYDNGFIGVNTTSSNLASFINSIPPTASNGYNGMYVRGTYTASTAGSHGLYVDDYGGSSNTSNGNYNAAIIADVSGLANYPSSTYFPTNYGVFGFSQLSNSNAVNVGLRGQTQSGLTNTGVEGYAGTDCASCNGTNTGVSGVALGAPTAKGGYFSGQADGSGGSLAEGIYATASGGATNWAGYFSGDVQITGNCWHGSTMEFSDQSLKTDIQPILNSQEILSQLQAHSFYYDTTNYGYLGLPSSMQYGVIAQEVDPIAPSMVSHTTLTAIKDSLGNIIHPAKDVEGVNYRGFIALLIDGYQKQQQSITSLQDQLNNLQTQLNACGCGQFGLRSSNSGSSGNANDQSVELKSENKTYLGQSVPNPHKDQCTIPYYIDESITNAVIVFNDEMGREVNRVELLGHGNGQLTVLSSNLADGIYTYSLIADGNVIDTKKMVKQH